MQKAASIRPRTSLPNFLKIRKYDTIPRIQHLSWATAASSGLAAAWAGTGGADGVPAAPFAAAVEAAVAFAPSGLKQLDHPMRPSSCSEGRMT